MSQKMAGTMEVMMTMKVPPAEEVEQEAAEAEIQAETAALREAVPVVETL